MRKDLFERSGGVTLSDGPASRAKLQPSLNFRTVEEGLKAAHRDVHIRYRKDDDLEVTTENHRRLSAILEKFCLSFRRPIRVLDAGCGTGRYFHCLKNVTGLVGIDLSPEMLQAAQTPVRQEAVSAEAIQLVCGNVHLLSFPAQAFDFIYSLGMFGNGCPVTVELCNKFHEWLAEGGKLFFNAVDMATVPLVTRMRHQLRSLLRGCRAAGESRSKGAAAACRSLD